jgi:hypothetical protein
MPCDMEYVSLRHLRYVLCSVLKFADFKKLANVKSQPLKVCAVEHAALTPTQPVHLGYVPLIRSIKTHCIYLYSRCVKFKRMHWPVLTINNCVMFCLYNLKIVPILRQSI